jgi:hypothetical protein
MLHQAGVDNQLSWISWFTQLLKQPDRQANGFSFHTWLATTTTASTAVITANFMGLMGHFGSF